jgi:hypothetical protein
MSLLFLLRTSLVSFTRSFRAFFAAFFRAKMHRDKPLRLFFNIYIIAGTRQNLPRKMVEPHKKIAPHQRQKARPVINVGSMTSVSSTERRGRRDQTSKSNNQAPKNTPESNHRSYHGHNKSPIDLQRPEALCRADSFEKQKSIAKMMRGFGGFLKHKKKKAEENKDEKKEKSTSSVSKSVKASSKMVSLLLCVSPRPRRFACIMGCALTDRYTHNACLLIRLRTSTASRPSPARRGCKRAQRNGRSGR